MIKWSMTKYTRPTARKAWGVTAAKSNAEILKCFVEQWLKLFADVLPHYPANKWDSINCHVAVDNGAVDIGPLRGSDRLTGLPGCALVFTHIRDRIQSLDGDDGDDDLQAMICNEQTARLAALLMEAWLKVRRHESITAIVNEHRIPYRILDVLQDRRPIFKGKLPLVP